MKKCRKCGKVKNLEEFGRLYDGLKPACKGCLNIEHRVWRKNNPKYSREWKKRNPSHRAKYEDNNKEKMIAWNIVDRERASGRLVSLPCFVCGDIDSETHHEDYAKPLSITWLCKDHHSERHVELRKGR